MSTTGDNTLFLDASNPGIVGLGLGNDRYVLSGSSLRAGQQITINDADGANILQLVGGLAIASSQVSNNAIQLTLTNGAIVNVLGASTFTFLTGGDAFTGTGGLSQTFSEFVTVALGSTVPAAGAASVPVGPVTLVNPSVPVLPTFSVAGPADVAEGASATFTVTLSAAQSSATTVSYALAGTGGATLGTDTGVNVPAGNTGTLTFAAGEVSKTVVVPITADTISPEAGEGVSITLSAPSTGTAVSTTAGTVTTAITDVPVTYTLTASAANVFEGVAITYTLTASAASTTATSVDFSVVPGDPAAANVGTNNTNLADFAQGAFNPTTVVMAAGATTATYTVTSLADTITELPENYSVKAVIGGTTVATKTTSLLDGGGTGPGAVGTTFTLTNSVETLTGTSGNDTFNAIVDTTGATVLSTLNSGDSINGGAGTDKLNVTYTGTTGNPVVDLTSVEQVYLRPLVNTTQSAATWTGVEQIWADRSAVGSTLTVNNVASKDVVFGLNQVQGDNSVARSEVQTVVVTNAATGAVSFLGQPVAASANADTPALTVTKIIADAAAIIGTWNGANPTRELLSITAGPTATSLTLTYANTEGDVAVVATATSAGVTFAESVETVKGAAAANTVELTAGVVASQLTGTTDKLNLAVVDSGRVEQVAATESVAAIYSYAQVAATAGYEQLAVTATGTKASAIDANGVGAALTTLEIAGSQAVEVLVNNTALKTVTVTNTAGSTVSLAGSTQNVTATLAGGNDALTTGSGNDNITASAGNNTINAGTGNDVVTTGAGNDTITVGAGSVNVNAGDGNNVVIVAGLDKTDVIKSGAGTTDVLGLTVTNAVAASANDTAGAELRATYSGFETLRITDAITAQTVEAGRLGFANSVQINGAVTGAATLNGIANGATITVNTAAASDWTGGTLNIGMTDAATNSNDQLNVNLRSNLLVADNNLAVTFGITGINKVKLDGADATNFAGDDGQTLDANKDNGPDDGYTVTLASAANLNTLEITGSSFINYTASTGTNALKLVDASASTGNSVISVATFAGTERVEIKGSQGTNTITGSDQTFGEKITGGAKADIIDAGQGADDITGNGGRDIFKFTTGDSIATALTKISDFGKVTEAVLAGDVNGMNSDAAFQSATSGKGGANADLIDFVTAPTLGVAAAAASVVATLENIEVGDQFAGKEITVTESAKGILTLGGADKAMVDTLTEWLHIANFSAGVAGDVVAFEFNGNTYAFQQFTTTANHISDDNVIELTGVTGVTGITLIGNNAAAIGDILIG